MLWFKTYLFTRISVAVHAENELSDACIMLRVHDIQHDKQQIESRQQRILV